MVPREDGEGLGSRRLDAQSSRRYPTLTTPILSQEIEVTERTSIPTSGKAPPGPRDLPVFGSLFSLRNDPHMAIHRFARQYGDVCCLQLDSVPTVAISHPELLKEAFDKTELSASSASEIMDIGAHHGKDLALAPYGEHWRQLQCFANRELLGSRQLQQIRE